METFLSSNQDAMKRVLKSVDQYDKGLKSLSTWWEKIALIGKINSFEVASTILQDMETTLDQFNTLQKRLITSLINEHSRKIIFQNNSRCQMGIDVLIRNLFERTADIGFLSTDNDVVEFLKENHIQDDAKRFINDRLQSYINIYSVYQDAILLKPNGDVAFQLSQPSRGGQVQDRFIKDALNNPNDYVEYFGKSKLMGERESNLLYANAVKDGDTVVGVIVLCFRFSNELEGIVKNLMMKGEDDHFLLTNGAGEVIYAPHHNLVDGTSRVALSESPSLETFNSKKVLKVCVSGQEYQGYAGPSNWHMASLLPLENIGYEVGSSDRGKEGNAALIKDLGGLISADLFDVRHQSQLVNDDLQLIVLNGIITAARKDATEFMPVLEAIKRIGQDIDDIFAQSIESLFSTIIAGQLEAIRLQAGLAVDIMDRNLFERANDCRWWGLSNLLRKALSSKVVDVEIIKETLSTIHSLYTVYHTLYVYDKQGRYIAFSDDTYSDSIGTLVEPHSGAKDIFQFTSPYQYSVSPFEKFDCYQGESTYIYNAALRDQDNQNDIVGGIGIVFDSTVEFSAILNDILPKEEDGKVIEGAKALFTNEQGLILSSTSEEFPIGETFAPEIDRVELNDRGSLATAIKLADGQMYLIGVAISKGYREYKIEDGYENTVLSWVMKPC
ncbi:cache domain-containing protein [Marinomonas sp. C2222]|uniref:Cache domain-containing protein n=1 Tax=Marinomonas sargassi TaxID=2984494 RepID=A0ABT2YVC4_9GAMM|nr:cache domain-containing protein [Marinomonas sargassi]MCV2403852.1 cache domain-containing protein [Marinomonas sargassi]